jgi:CheY-like chemotaxis protein
MTDRPAVIVVDNHPEILEVLSGVLETLGYTTHAAAGYDEAVALLQQHPVCAIITDVEMEPKTGFELLTTCRSKYPQTPVIMVSSYANPKMEKRALLEGAARFLPKPFSMEQLHDALEECAGITYV